MFRDPSCFLTLRETNRADAADLPLGPGLGGGLQHRRRSLVAGDPAARGRACWNARTIYATGHQPGVAATRPQPGHLPDGARCAGYTANYQRRRRQQVASPTTTPPPTMAARVRPVAVRQRACSRPQPGDRQRVRRNAAGVVPQRADLLQPGAAGPRARPVPRCRCATAAFSAWGQEEHRLLVASPPLRTLARADLVTEQASCHGRERTTALPAAPARPPVDRRLGGRRRRARSLLLTCRADAWRLPLVVVIHLPSERRRAGCRRCSRRAARSRCAKAEDKAPRRGGTLSSRRRATTCRSSATASSR